MAKAPTVTRNRVVAAPGLVAPQVEQVFEIIEAAQHLRVGKTFIFDRIRDGDLKLTKLGRRSVIKASDLQRYIDSQ